jgi:hypothetical protein
MKRTALALAFVFALTLISGAKGLQFDISQFEGFSYKPPIVSVVSPFQNATYSVQEVPLNVTVQIRGWIFKNIERIRRLDYSLDGQTAIPLTLNVPSMYDISLPYPVYGNSMLTNLSDGSHNLTIFGETFISGLNACFNYTVFFSVDTSYMPTVAPVSGSLLFAASVGFDIVAIGLLVYFKKRKE